MIKTSQRQFQIGHLSIDLLTIDDAEALLDELIAKGPGDADYQDEVMPYWADLWHSALGLSYWMVKNPMRFTDKAVIEIGCGLGLPGIVASLLGAKVTFTDYVTPALDFAQQNLILNQANHRAQFELLDWRNPPLDRTYDLVIAADVAYERRYFQPLYRCIHQLIGHDGLCLLSEPGRPIGQDFLAGFAGNGFVEDFLTSEVATLEKVERTISIRGVRRK